jgi:hypothetical protein
MGSGWMTSRKGEVAKSKGERMSSPLYSRRETLQLAGGKLRKGERRLAQCLHFQTFRTWESYDPRVITTSSPHRSFTRATSRAKGIDYRSRSIRLVDELEPGGRLQRESSSRIMYRALVQSPPRACIGASAPGIFCPPRLSIQTSRLGIARSPLFFLIT